MQVVEAASVFKKSVGIITTIKIRCILAIQVKNTLSLTTFWTTIGPYDLFYMVIHVTFTNLTIRPDEHPWITCQNRKPHTKTETHF